MVRLNKQSNIEFYVGIDINGNKIPIPFENILVNGNIGIGKSMFVHNLLQDALLRYPGNKIQFRIWSPIPEYSIWDVAKVTDGKRNIPGIRIVETGNFSQEDLKVSLEGFLKEAADVCRTRHNLLKDYNLANIWDYNRAGDDTSADMIPLVYVVDEWADDITKDSQTSFQYIMKHGKSTGIILLWVAHNQLRISDGGPAGQFYKNFPLRFVFTTSEENSEKVIGSTYCANEFNKGVGRGMCIYQKNNLPYMPLDIPKFSYSLGKKIARALSQEII